MRGHADDAASRSNRSGSSSTTRNSSAPAWITGSTSSGIAGRTGRRSRESLPATARLWFVESNGPQLYTEAKFAADDYLVFGRETAGLPKQLLEENRDRWLRIPMFNAEARSLNLSNCVALVLFEALRQQGFPGEIC